MHIFHFLLSPVSGDQLMVSSRLSGDAVINIAKTCQFNLIKCIVVTVDVKLNCSKRLY